MRVVVGNTIQVRDRGQPKRKSKVMRLYNNVAKLRQIHGTINRKLHSKPQGLTRPEGMTA
jgi:hypothetical protein